MWKPGDTVMWRGIFRGQVWHVQPTVVVKDDPNEVVLTLMPGAECIAEETYPKGKKIAKRWWDFKESDWTMAKYTWRTNRLLLILVPEKYYSTILFWDHQSNKFLYYYVNFQTPFKRTYNSIDMLDLELDLIIHPDFHHEWKDLDDYQMAIQQGIISPEHMHRIDGAKPEIFSGFEKRQYPFDGSWLDWKPDPSWMPPKLPANWDKI